MRKSRPLCTKTTCTKNLVWCKSSTEWCKPLSILDPQLVLNCLAAGLQTLQGFSKVFQQLHCLCESDYGLNTTSAGAVQSYDIPYESSCGVSIFLDMWLKSSLHLSRVCHSHQTSWRDQFSRFMLGTHDLRAPNVEVVKFEDLIWCKPSTEWCKPLSILDPQLVLNCLEAGLQTMHGFSKVFQQLHYLCESDYGLNETSAGAVQSCNIPWESCYGGVHLLEHVIKEFPTSVKSMPQPSDLMKRTVLTLHARITLLKRCI